MSPKVSYSFTLLNSLKIVYNRDVSLFIIIYYYYYLLFLLFIPLFILFIQRAKEKFPDARPRIISDNGPQFIAKDFKEFIRLSGMTHVRTSPYYPQSNGKLERYHKTIKGECIRSKTPLSLDDARRLVAEYVEHYNTVRLHTAIGYIAPADKLNGRENLIFKIRDRKLEDAREQRKLKRQQAYKKTGSSGFPGSSLTHAA